MGCICSKKNDKYSRITPDLSSYEHAYRVDPDLRRFDSGLHDRASRVIPPFAAGVPSFSLESLGELTQSSLDTYPEVVEHILQSKKDIWNNKELFNLVEIYFKSSLKTLDLFRSLQGCLQRARDSHAALHAALRRFHAGEKNEASRTALLRQLESFTAAGNPFSGEMSSLFDSIYEEHVLLLKKLKMEKDKLDRKMKKLKEWRKLSNILFVATFAAVLTLSVVAAAVTAPPVMAALAAAATVPLGSVGGWLISFWNKRENVVKGERSLFSSMYAHTVLAKLDLQTNRTVVDRLGINMNSLLYDADFAVENEDEVMNAVEEIVKKMVEFSQSIEELGTRVDNSSAQIKKARMVILQKYNKPPKS